MTNLQKTIKLVILIITALFVSEQLVFGELKKSDIWQADKIQVRGWFDDSHVGVYDEDGNRNYSLTKEEYNKVYKGDDYYTTMSSLDYSLKGYRSYAPVNYFGYTIYGQYSRAYITLYKTKKDYDKWRSDKKFNSIYIRMAAIYTPNAGYKIYSVVYDNNIKPAVSFEDMTIGIVNTNNNTFICNTKTSKKVDSVFKYYTNRYMGEAILNIPDNFTNFDCIQLYISNNYLPNIYIDYPIGMYISNGKAGYNKFIEAKS